MIDAMIYDVVPRAGVIDLGKQVEGLVTRVVLPNIRRGAGTVQLVHQRSDDQKPYPVPVTEDGDKVYWIVTRSDTAFPGRGQAELQWLGENGAVAKSVTYQTNTTRSMAEPGPEPDEPLKPYTQAVAKDAQAAKNAAANATEAARSAEASAGQAGLSAATAVAAAKNAEAIVGQAGQSAQSAQAAALAAAQNAAAAETAEAGAHQAQTGAEAAKTEAQAAKTAAEKATREAKTAQTGAVEAKTGAEAAQAKAEEAAQGIAADREQIGANTAGLEAAQQDVTALKAENTTLKASTARTARSLDYLWKKSKGVVYDTETVTGAGSSVTVPSGAMDYAALRKVGGMSQRDEENSVLIDAPVDAVRVQGRNLLNPEWKTTTGTTINYGKLSGGIPLKKGREYTLSTTNALNLKGLYFRLLDNTILAYTYTDSSLSYTPPEDVIVYVSCYCIPSVPDNAELMLTVGWQGPYAPYREPVTHPIPHAIRDLCPDYGVGVSADCYNYIDFAAKQYHHRVGQVDLGTLKFEKQDTTNGNWRFQVSFSTMLLGTTNVLTAKYTFVGDKTWYGVFGVSTNGNQLQICDMAYTTADDFVAAIAGQTLCYELATPEAIDLSAVWPDDFGILRVEAGGTINLHYPALDDGFELAVPSETEIMVDVAKVVGTDG